MYCLVSGKGSSERFYGKGDEFEFALKDNKRLRFKGRLNRITERGLAVIENLKVWQDGEYTDLDGVFKLGVYEFSEFRKVGGSSSLSNFSIVVSESLKRVLSSSNEEVVFNVGDKVSLDYYTSGGRSVFSGVLFAITDKDEVVLNNCSLTEHTVTNGKRFKRLIYKDSGSPTIKVNSINKMWFSGNGRNKYSVKIVKK